MRLNWTDDEDHPGQFALWQANCRRSLRSRQGQAMLRELEAALLALPEKRLVAHTLATETGDVCAVGALAKYQGHDLTAFDWEYESDAVGIQLGMPRLVAWSVVAQNDIENDGRYEIAEGPSHNRWGSPGYSVFIATTPEERYERMLLWVQEQLRAPDMAIEDARTQTD